MIKENDRIAVGVSGGKDSVALLAALNALQKFYPVNFDIVAVTLDPMFSEKKTDYTKISELCDNLKVPYIVKQTDIFEVASKGDLAKNPCSLCAKLRRGILHNTAIEQGCNSVALGHHMDDAVETFFMNLFDGGRISCFSPVSYLSEKKLTLIRPMIFLYENEISRFIKKYDYPTVKSICPVDGHTERARIKALVKELEQKYPALRKKITGALQKDAISNWDF